MSHLFDAVPHALLPTLTKQVQALFSSRRTFYYCKDRIGTLLPLDAYEEHYDCS